MKAFLRFFLVLVVPLFCLAASSWGQVPCSARDLSRIGETTTYVDTIDKTVSIDSMTNQKVTTFRLRVTSMSPGVTSSRRICITKEPGELKEALRPPQLLPPVKTEAPPAPPDTVILRQTNPPPVVVKQHSCWSRLSLCYIVPAAILGFSAYECATHHWCPRSGDETNVSNTVYVSHDRRARIGFVVPLFIRP